MSILEWIVIGQVLIFVFVLIISCHLLSKYWLQEVERIRTKGGEE